MKRTITSCLIFLLSITSSSGAPSVSKSEYEIKAGFIYQFLFYTEWETNAIADSNEDIVIGILGNDPFGDAFDSVDGKTVNDKKLRIKRFGGDASLETIKQCRILFISSSLISRLEDILSMLNELPILTVSDIGGFTDLGGMICFVTNDNRVNLKINRVSAKRVGITFHSKLLRVAETVRE